MALVRLSQEIVSIRGRSGGNYFRLDSGGQHIQAMPRTVKYARTGVQADRISGYSEMAVFWALALIAGYSVLWTAFALNHYFRGDDGVDRRITGYMWYIHYWLLFPEVERLPFWKPPHAPGDLPDYIVTCSGLLMYRIDEADWPAHYCAGYFWEGIPWNGKPSYRTDDMNWYIWWADTRWAISPGLGFEPPDLTFYGDSEDIIDYYRHAPTGRYAHCYQGKRPGL